jgi:hypothetical protein
MTMHNKITLNLCLMPALLLLLSACAAAPQSAASLQPAGETIRYRYQDQRFRGTNLGFTDDVKAKLQQTDIDIVDLTLAIQNQLRLHDRLEPEAAYLVAVTIEELHISPVYETALFSFRTEEDRIGGKVEIIDDSKATLGSFKIAVATDPKEAIKGGKQGRLLQLYQLFAERVVTMLLDQNG